MKTERIKVLEMFFALVLIGFSFIINSLIVSKALFYLGVVYGFIILKNNPNKETGKRISLLVILKYLLVVVILISFAYWLLPNQETRSAKGIQVLIFIILALIFFSNKRKETPNRTDNE